MPTDLLTLLAGRTAPLVVAAAHDALSARMIEDAGFACLGIGGAALSATQLAVPDIGVQSFGEYRDAVRRIVEATPLPAIVDGENGFGDAPAVTRTIRDFDRMGVAALAIEDLHFPPRPGRPPGLIPAAEMVAKLRAARAARRGAMALIARTDAGHAASVDEAVARARLYREAGADIILPVGLPDADAYRRLRDAVRCPLIALSAVGTPWFAPTVGEVAAFGYEAAMFPTPVLLHMAAGIARALAALRDGTATTPEGFGFPDLARLLRAQDWAAIDG